MLGCKTLSPKRSVGLKNPRPIKRSRPAEGVQDSGSEREGCVEAELPVDGRAEVADGECVPDLKGERGVGHKWSSVLKESTMVTIEDSQLPE